MVIDIIDNFSIFARQGEKRIKFYKKNNYDIVNVCLDPREKNKGGDNDVYQFHSDSEEE